MTGPVHPAGQSGFDPAIVATQRRQARRAAVALGFVALCIFIGFIVAVGLRS